MGALWDTPPSMLQRRRTTWATTLIQRRSLMNMSWVPVEASEASAGKVMFGAWRANAHHAKGSKSSLLAILLQLTTPTFRGKITWN